MTKLLFTALLGLFSLLPAEAQTIYKTPTLEIDSVAPNTYVHRTFLLTKTWGNVPCNGLVYVNQGEAAVFDTPCTDSVSLQLMHWIRSHTRARIVAIVVNHFHDDCLGGLRAFHQAGVRSYSSELCRQLARKAGVTVPQQGFRHLQRIRVGKTTIENFYPGAGHTRDNIVSYIPATKVLFGGCILKEVYATKGNLADADTTAWSGSICRIRQRYPQARVLVPGHGDYGGQELLHYTEKLFR